MAYVASVADFAARAGTMMSAETNTAREMIKLLSEAEADELCRQTFLAFQAMAKVEATIGDLHRKASACEAESKPPAQPMIESIDVVRMDSPASPSQEVVVDTQALLSESESAEDIPDYECPECAADHGNTPKFHCVGCGQDWEYKYV